MTTTALDFGSIPLEAIKPGMKAFHSQTITDADLKAFAGVSGDHNPIHINAEYAAKSRFKKRIAHGILLSSYFSQLIAMKLPGPGAIYVSQSLKFKKPVYIDDTVTAVVEVVSVDNDRRRVFLSTKCFVNDEVTVDGEAEVYIP